MKFFAEIKNFPVPVFAVKVHLWRERSVCIIGVTHQLLTTVCGRDPVVAPLLNPYLRFASASQRMIISN